MELGLKLLASKTQLRCVYSELTSRPEHPKSSRVLAGALSVSFFVAYHPLPFPKSTRISSGGMTLAAL